MKKSSEAESLSLTDFKKVRHDFNRILYGLETAASIPNEKDKETRNSLLTSVRSELKDFSDLLNGIIERSLND